jgi:hypothetical protein
MSTGRHILSVMSKGPCLLRELFGEGSEPGTPLHNDSIRSNPLRPGMKSFTRRRAGPFQTHGHAPLS